MPATKIYRNPTEWLIRISVAGFGTCKIIKQNDSEICHFKEEKYAIFGANDQLFVVKNAIESMVSGEHWSV